MVSALVEENLENTGLFISGAPEPCGKGKQPPAVNRGRIINHLR